MNSIVIPLPAEYSHPLTLSFLKRSPRELLHRTEHEVVTKAMRLGKDDFVYSIYGMASTLKIEFLKGQPNESQKKEIVQYVREWFDLDTDLKPFYKLAKKDPLLRELVKKFHGYRIIGQPDLFESLIWAVLGQQINLGFAYTLKQRFVEKFGETIEVNDHPYYLFPSFATVALLSPEQLLVLQFSRQKAAYTIGIANAFLEGKISRQKLTGLSLGEARNELIKIKGIGNWTANYALMKTFRHPDAFPLEDAGLHNAIKNQLQLKAKPKPERVKKIFRKYEGWEAYATLYLWRSL